MIWSENLGHEIGTYNSLGALKINPKPFIHSTENTIVCCRICKGIGLNTICYPNAPLLNKCVLCKGEKRRSNRL